MAPAQSGFNIWTVFYTAVLILLSLTSIQWTVPLVLLDSVSVHFAATLVKLLTLSCSRRSDTSSSSSGGCTPETSQSEVKRAEDRIAMGIVRVENPPAIVGKKRKNLHSIKTV